MTFTHPQAPVPLRGLVDTGSGVSILSLEAYNAIAPGSTYCIKPYDIHLFAANGSAMQTYGMVENVRFHLAGYELSTNFVIIDDKLGVPGFLLGRNFLRQHNVLVDLSAMKIVVREPNSSSTFQCTR